MCYWSKSSYFQERFCHEYKQNTIWLDTASLKTRTSSNLIARWNGIRNWNNPRRTRWSDS